MQPAQLIERFSEPHKYKRTDVVEVLADHRAIPELIDALEHANYLCRCGAAYTLGVIGDKQALEPLLNALNDNSRDVRHDVISALDNLNDPRAVMPLIRALSDDDELVRTEAAHVLGKLGDKRAMIPLIGKLNDSSINVLSQVIGALAKIGDQSAIPPLQDMLRHRSDIVRAAALHALSKIAGQRAIAAIVRHLHTDPHYHVRAQAARALANIHHPRVPEVLQDVLLNEKDSIVCTYAAEALGEIRDPNTIPALIEAVVPSNKLNAFTLDSVRVTLHKFGAVAVDPLIDALAEAIDVGGQFYISRILASIGSPAVPAIIDSLDYPDKQVRLALIFVLDEIGDKRAIEPLEDLVNHDPDPDVRHLAEAAIESLSGGAASSAGR